MRAGAAYEGSTESISDARVLTRTFLDQARAGGVRVSDRAWSDAQLVVSELVTNACKYAPGPCALGLEVHGPLLEITLWDSEPTLPMARAAEPGRIGQHGLEIIFALCDGFEVRREPVGKRICVRLSLSLHVVG
ncbi:ATP-binding protein [Streptomyces sp. PLK6-54]|uniref:ATP-binding protein n=1 Tax=Actinacidiphila acidipaludis TaxID=2873382 RepID=A0ABS7QA53_9ACTN|nr:ATP-binding protein [Streptomyces acidipaludis]